MGNLRSVEPYLSGEEELETGCEALITGAAEEEEEERLARRGRLHSKSQILTTLS